MGTANTPHPAHVELDAANPPTPTPFTGTTRRTPRGRYRRAVLAWTLLATSTACAQLTPPATQQASRLAAPRDRNDRLTAKSLGLAYLGMPTEYLEGAKRSVCVSANSKATDIQPVACRRSSTSSVPSSTR